MAGAFIDKANWLVDNFARLSIFVNILSEPESKFHELSDADQNRLRQTQAHANEVIRVLGYIGQQSLIMKYDGVVGWIPTSSFRIDSSLKNFEIRASSRASPYEFLEEWKGTPYLWGGLSKAGVDCSGMTQEYFLAVYGRILPKNSRDQRKAGKHRDLSEIQDGDLIFCHRKSKTTHHVGIFLDSNVWHASAEEGVTCQRLEAFLTLYEIEAVVEI